MREEEKRFAECLDVEYSYRLAKKLEQYKTNPYLGYRTAGSAAELLTGDMLAEEMERIGLRNVRKDQLRLDSWDFHHAILRYQDREGNVHECQMGAYQTNFHTDVCQL